MPHKVRVRALSARERQRLAAAIEATKRSPAMKAAMLDALDGVPYREAAARHLGAGDHRYRDLARAVAAVPGLQDARLRALLYAKRENPRVAAWRVHLDRASERRAG